FLELGNEEKAILSFHKPDLKEKIFYLLSGLLVSVPFTVFFFDFSNSLCNFMPLFFAQVCSIAIVAPFIEEFAKVFPLFYRHGETERSIMNLGILVGLGFGITEFLLYILALEAPLVSRLPSVIFHATSTGITSYGIIKNKPFRFYIFSVVLHIINNLVAIFSISVPGLFVIAIINLVLTYYFAWYFYRKTSEKIIV
ncbi:MAG: PrsW family intramembrane metalloprotease, partial [Candidatus Bathyarchaeota archaeon]|nr:PrsW family intramembrane metalloprotease [Candidatus Bathyarchaeota archaeon]